MDSREVSDGFDRVSVKVKVQEPHHRWMKKDEKGQGGYGLGGRVSL